LASITLRNDRFPTGTLVNVYPARYRHDGEAPTGDAVTSATVAANGDLIITGLDAGTYIAYAQVAGEHRYVNLPYLATTYQGVNGSYGTTIAEGATIDTKNLYISGTGADASASTTFHGLFNVPSVTRHAVFDDYTAQGISNDGGTTIYELMAGVYNTGTKSTVAGGFMARGYQVWGINVVSRADNQIGAVAIGIEVDFGIAAASTGESTGLSLHAHNNHGNTGGYISMLARGRANPGPQSGLKISVVSHAFVTTSGAQVPDVSGVLTIGDTTMAATNGGTFVYAGNVYNYTGKNSTQLTGVTLFFGTASLSIPSGATVNEGVQPLAAGRHVHPGLRARRLLPGDRPVGPASFSRPRSRWASTRRWTTTASRSARRAAVAARAARASTSTRSQHVRDAVRPALPRRRREPGRRLDRVPHLRGRWDYARGLSFASATFSDARSTWATATAFKFGTATGGRSGAATGEKTGLWGFKAGQPTVTGSRGGATTTVLANLLTALASYGAIVDSTTA
jgi:hypothetical protein